MGKAPILCLLLVAGCADAPAPVPEVPVETAAPATVTVYFTRDEAPVPVTRTVEAPADLAAALRELVRGPTEAERAAGIVSWFSEETAGVLIRAEVGPEGDAVVDFRDLRRIIPNASTSTGSAMLLGELEATVFQFPEIRSVEYRLEGSCEMFWSWLQYGCERVDRP